MRRASGFRRQQLRNSAAAVSADARVLTKALSVPRNSANTQSRQQKLQERQ